MSRIHRVCQIFLNWGKPNLVAVSEGRRHGIGTALVQKSAH